MSSLTQSLQLAAVDGSVIEVALSDDRWEAFVGAHPEGLVYHLPVWLKALAHEHERQHLCLGFEDSSGKLRGVLPLLATRGLPLSRSAITARRLSSLPRTPVSGPLAVDAEAAAALVRAAVDRVRANPGTRLELKVGSPCCDGLEEGLVRIPWRYSYVLRLPAFPENLRFGNSRNHSRIEWAVRKAMGRGVRVRAAESQADLSSWYRLYLDTMRRQVVPPRPFRFFQALWNFMRPQGLATLLLAEQTEGRKRSLLAGSVFLKFGRTVFYAFNGSRRDALHLRPNDMIQYEAIHDACRHGFEVYDLGEVAQGGVGLANFKSKWGAEEKALYRYYYPPVQEAGEVATRSGFVRAAAEAAWQRLPLAWTAGIGAAVYRFM